MQKRNKKVILIFCLSLTIIILLPIIAYFASQSSYFLDFTRKSIITQVNKQINGRIDIADLEGNIFQQLTLSNISLFLNEDEVISLNELKLNYDLRGILQKKIIISSVLISDLKIKLHQDEEGVWDLTKLAKTQKYSVIDSTNIDKSASAWQVELVSFILSNAKVDISGVNLPEQYPQEILISQINSQASLGQEVNWLVSNTQIAIQPQNITLSLKDLKGNNKLAFSLAQLDISSPKSLIHLSGDMGNNPYRHASLNFKANPIDLSEVKIWLPDFPLEGNPTLIGEVELVGDSLSTQVTVNLDEQVIKLKAELPNFNNPLTSNLDLTWEKIDIAKWKNGLPVSALTGNLIASIDGESWREIDSQVILRLSESDYNTYKIHSFDLKANGSPAHLNSTIQAYSEFGQLSVKAEVDSLLGEISYAMSGYIQDLDLHKIAPNLPYQAEINSNFNLVGSGKDPDFLDADVSFDLSGSYLANKLVDKLKIQGEYHQGKYDLKAMKLSYDGLEVDFAGKGDIYNDNSVSYKIQVNSLPQILTEIQPDLSLKGFINGSVKGRLEDIKANVSIDLQDVEFKKYKIASLKGKSNINVLDKIPIADFTGSLTDINLENFPLDSILVISKYSPEKVFLKLDVNQSDTLGVSLKGDIYLAQQQAYFSELKINALGQNWENKADTLKIKFDPKHLALHNLELESNKQVISADFTLDSEDSYDISVKFDSLAVWPLRYLNPQLETINGQLSLDISGSGKFEEPQLDLTWYLNNLSWEKVKINKMMGHLNYQNDLAQMNLEINRIKEELISLSGYLPFHANISNKEFELLRDEQVKLDLQVTPLDLTNLNDFIGSGKELSGTLNLSGKIENTLNNPQMKAKLMLSNVDFKLPAWGIDYRNINVDFQANQNMLELKELSLISGKKGYLKVNGSTILNLKETQLDSLKLALDAKNWQVLKNRDMDLLVDSKIKIAGNSQYPTFSGYLNVQRASLYLPALLGNDKTKVNLTTPLLLANSSTSNVAEITDSNEAKKSSQILKNLRGSMKISFPHNTWLTSKEMNLELGGEIEIIKNSPDFSLSGNIMVVRGNYTIYGRKFTISSGNIYFQGESDMNPEIDLIADYVLRNSAGEKVTLSLKISGRLQEPVLQFYIDGQEISEGDGLSYIIFGKSTAELSSGEKSQISSSNDSNLATKIIMSQISSRVSSVIQNKLNLDVVEFNGDDNWRQAQIVLGKYITNNLFLSYEQEFSFGSEDEIAPEEITLEYEFSRRFSLQATQSGDKTSGIDFIWKYQK